MHDLLQKKSSFNVRETNGYSINKSMNRNMICKFRIGSVESKPKSLKLSVSWYSTCVRPTSSSVCLIKTSVGMMSNVAMLTIKEKTVLAFVGII